MSSILVFSGSQTVQAKPAADDAETMPKARAQQAKRQSLSARSSNTTSARWPRQRGDRPIGGSDAVRQIAARSRMSRSRSCYRIITLLTLVGNVKILFLCVVTSTAGSADRHADPQGDLAGHRSARRAQPPLGLRPGQARRPRSDHLQQEQADDQAGQVALAEHGEPVEDPGRHQHLDGASSSA